MATESAKKYGLKVDVFLAQIRKESGFNPKPKYNPKASGIAQIAPATAKAWKVNPYNPRQALDASAKHMASYVKTYKEEGMPEKTAYTYALATYNGGPGAAKFFKKKGGVYHNPKAPRDSWPNQTGEYVKVVIKAYKDDKES